MMIIYLKIKYNHKLFREFLLIFYIAIIELVKNHSHM